jgi:hypothetical protein
LKTWLTGWKSGQRPELARGAGAGANDGAALVRVVDRTIAAGAAKWMTILVGDVDVDMECWKV